MDTGAHLSIISAVKVRGGEITAHSENRNNLGKITVKDRLSTPENKLLNECFTQLLKRKVLCFGLNKRGFL